MADREHLLITDGPDGVPGSLASPAMSADSFDPEHGYQQLGENLHYDPMNPDHVREKLHSRGEMAVGPLCYSMLEHAADGVTHADKKIISAFLKLQNVNQQQCSGFLEQGRQVAQQVKSWMMANPYKTALMFAGIGGTAYEAKTIANLMQGMAQHYINWSKKTTTLTRFFGFVGLMMVRLVVATLVPPTSPAFGLILQAATPESEKWTAMPLFLAASTVAGAMPYVIDKVIQAYSHSDFIYTKFMKRFADEWPLTCWTGPTMRTVFESVGGDKTGASVAVIVAHAAPFMGAQTTNMQRYFLPHPLDTIISQPFGMAEELLGIALAEGSSSPVLASTSVTVLVASFNFLQAVVFSRCKDFKAYLIAIFNMIVGGACAYMLGIASANVESNASTHAGLWVVALQLMIQLFLIPALVSGVDQCAADPVDDKRKLTECMGFGSSNSDVTADLTRNATAPRSDEVVGSFESPYDIPESFSYMWGLRSLGITFKDFTAGTEAYRDAARNLRKTARNGQVWAWLGIFRLFTVYAGFPFWAWHMAECNDLKDQANFGMAFTVTGEDTPMLVTFWLLYYPTFFILQYLCLQAVLGSQLRSIKLSGDERNGLRMIIGSNYAPLQWLVNRLLCCCKCNFSSAANKAFWLWFWSVSLIPFFARHMAFMWNAEVLGMIWHKCPKTEAFNRIWSKVMLDSGPYRFICHIFYMDPTQSEFRNFALFIYCLVFLQFGFAVAAYCSPCCRNLERLPTKTTGDRKGETTSTLSYKTLYDISGTNPLSVLMHLVDLAGFDAVTDLHTNYELLRLKHMKAKFRFGDNLSRDRQIDYLYSLLTLCQRMTAKFALVGLFQNAFTATLQVSFMAILVHEMKGFWEFYGDFQVVFWIVAVSFVGTFSAIGDVCNLIKIHRTYNSEEINIDTLADGHVTRLYDRLNRIRFRLWVYLFLYVWLTAWTTIKFIAIFACPSSMWNMPTSLDSLWNTGGCVDLNFLN